MALAVCPASICKHSSLQPWFPHPTLGTPPRLEHHNGGPIVRLSVLPVRSLRQLPRLPTSPHAHPAFDSFRKPGKGHASSGERNLWGDGSFQGWNYIPRAAQRQNSGRVAASPILTALASRISVASASATASSSATLSSSPRADDLLNWLLAAGFPLDSTVSLTESNEPGRELLVTCSKKISPGDVIFNIPENFSVTAVDVSNHPVLSPAAQPEAATSSRPNDLALLALWLLWESSQGDASPWAPYIRTFSIPVLSPLLWSPEERSTLLKGHSGLPEIESRLAEIDSYYQQLDRTLMSAEQSKFPPEQFSIQRFREAFVSILSRAVYLPEAGVFALVPVADLLRHGLTSTNTFEYSAESQAVVLKADRDIEPGQEVLACRAPGLTNLELAMQFGEVFRSNPNDFLTYSASLVRGDPLFLLKKQILQEEGFAEAASFPLFADRFPRQLLSYLRLTRLQDAAQFPKVTFKADLVVSDSNEYEVLMLVLNECKERLQAYPQALEDDARLTRNKSPPPPPRLQPVAVLQCVEEHHGESRGESTGRGFQEGAPGRAAESFGEGDPEQDHGGPAQPLGTDTGRPHEVRHGGPECGDQGGVPAHGGGAVCPQEIIY